jgi:hypothetical protein
VTTDVLPPDVCTPVPYGPEALDGQACANLLAQVLFEALYDASRGEPDARLWLTTPYSAHLARLLDIVDWPPSEAALARVRATRAHIRNGSSVHLPPPQVPG